MDPNMKITKPYSRSLVVYIMENYMVFGGDVGGGRGGDDGRKAE